MYQKNYLALVKNNNIYKGWKRFVAVILCIIITTSCFSHPATASATVQDKGVLNAFYPATTLYSDQMQQYIDQVDSICFAWSRIDASDPTILNTVKGKNGNKGFYYPSDYLKPVEYANNQGKSIQLSVYMSGSDAAKLLPYEDKQDSIIKAIVNSLQNDITQGEGIYYDGVVIDFEGLRNTDALGQSIMYGGELISSCFTEFLGKLKAELSSLNKKLYVAVNPGLYYDGYDYAGIMDVADQVILMAHDYEPLEKLRKDQVQQFTGNNTLTPINSPAPYPLVRQALNEILDAVSDTQQLSKVWLQVCFDSAQWQYDVPSAKDFESLPASTLSRKGRGIPLYKAIKARIDNTDGNGQNITYGYNNAIQSPYIQYYNTADKSWNVILYEDSNSINAKIDLAKVYGLGGISVWSLGNIPDYNDTAGKKFHLDVWSKMIASMSNYNVLPVGSNQYVNFTDSAIEQAVRDKIGKETGDISVYDLNSIYRLKLGQGVKSLKDLGKLQNLEYLSAEQQNLKDITALKALTKLRVLYLQRNQISDISALKKLTRLEILSLNGNRISSLSSLSALTNLKELYVRENKIKSITDLSKLSKLETLELGYNSIKKLDGLKNLQNLKNLSVDYNQISDITGIERVTKLQYLNLANNKISNLNQLKNLKGLKKLYLQRNAISSISSLSGLTNLTELSLNGNRITDLQPLKKLTALEKLYLKDNKLKSIAVLKQLKKLKELYLSGNLIKDYSPVSSQYSNPSFLSDF